MVRLTSCHLINSASNIEIFFALFCYKQYQYNKNTSLLFNFQLNMLLRVLLLVTTFLVPPTQAGVTDNVTISGFVDRDEQTCQVSTLPLPNFFRLPTPRHSTPPPHTPQLEPYKPKSNSVLPHTTTCANPVCIVLCCSSLLLCSCHAPFLLFPQHKNFKKNRTTPTHPCAIAPVPLNLSP